MADRPRIVRCAPGLIGATARTAVISGSAQLLHQLARHQPGSASSDLGTQLEDVCRLKRDGFLTDVEFAAAKARLLGLS
ncbi:MAG TPA: hypothetical protein VIH24_01430 [Candidatus Limnocylindria bacterium]|jgi:hypothetical protein